MLNVVDDDLFITHIVLIFWKSLEESLIRARDFTFYDTE